MNADCNIDTNFTNYFIQSISTTQKIGFRKNYMFTQSPKTKSTFLIYFPTNTEYSSEYSTTWERTTYLYRYGQTTS